MRNEADSLPKAMYLFIYCFPRQNLSGRKYVDLCLCLLMALGFLEVELVTMAILNQHTVFQSLKTHLSITIIFCCAENFLQIYIFVMQLITWNARFSQMVQVHFSTQIRKRKKHCQATRNGQTGISDPRFKVLKHVYGILNLKK